MRKLIAAVVLVLGGVAMSGSGVELKELEVGGYGELSARPNPKHYVLQFMPALVAVLLSVERKNGAPLTQAQVELIRDKASVMVVSPQAARAVEEKRGYRDIDASDAWREWQAARKELQ
jgi:hypothetical protein